MQIEKSNGVYFLQNRYQQAAFVLNMMALDLLPIAECCVTVCLRSRCPVFTAHGALGTWLVNDQ
jgi:hypothetical protein